MAKKILFVLNSFDSVSHTHHWLRLIQYLSQKTDFELFLYPLRPSGALKKDFEKIKHLTMIDRFEKKPYELIITKELRSEYWVFLWKWLYFPKSKHYTIRPSFGFVNDSLHHILKNIAFALSVHCVDLNICVGNTVAQRMKRLQLPEKRTTVISNSVDTTYFTPHHHKLHEPLTFIYTGLFIPRKNIMLILKVFQQLAKPYKLILVGKGPLLKTMQTFIRQHGMSQKVKIFPFTKDIRPYLAQADIFLLLSKQEGLSLSLLEAMAMGLCPLVSNIPENIEVVKQGKTGWIVNPHDSISLRRTIENMVSAERLKKNIYQFGAKATCFIQAHYSDKRMFKKYKAILYN